jgi:hypothetical protein
MLMLLVASVATALTVAGVVLFFSFAALTYESAGIEEILQMVVALIAAYFFIRVGRSVWRELRGRHPEVESGGSEREERGSAGGGGR